MRKRILIMAVMVMALCTLLVAAAALRVLGETLSAPKALPAAEPSGEAPPVYELLRRGGAYEVGNLCGNLANAGLCLAEGPYDTDPLKMWKNTYRGDLYYADGGDGVVYCERNGEKTALTESMPDLALLIVCRDGLVYARQGDDGTLTLWRAPWQEDGLSLGTAREVSRIFWQQSVFVADGGIYYTDPAGDFFRYDIEDDSARIIYAGLGAARCIAHEGMLYYIGSGQGQESAVYYRALDGSDAEPRFLCDAGGQMAVLSLNAWRDTLYYARARYAESGGLSDWEICSAGLAPDGVDTLFTAPDPGGSIGGLNLTVRDGKPLLVFLYRGNNEQSWTICELDPATGEVTAAA